MSSAATSTFHTDQAPGPRGQPLSGNLSDFTGELLAAMARDFAVYGDVVRYQVGPRTVHVLSHPELAQHVLVQHQREFPKFGGNGGLAVIAGNGLIANANPDSWLIQRRMMQPMFHRQRLAAMGDKMTAAGARMLERWAAYPAGARIDIGEEMLQVTLDIITQTMFSADVMHKVDSIGPAITAMMEYANHRIFNPLSPPAFWPTRRNRAFLAGRRTMDEIVYGLIRQRRAGGTSQGDLLDMLIEARDAETGEQMSDQQLRDEVLTIFGAGHETTANTLTFAWHALSQHPLVLERLRAEVDRVLGGRLPTLADLPNLPFTLQVFREAMRLYPAAPIVGPRRPLAETRLGGYRVPANSSLIVCIFNIHRHPDFWENPLVFDPDRFAPERSAGRHHLAFMPFGAGPRKCIGNNLAEMEGALLLALVAQRYELRAVPGHVVHPVLSITLRSKTGMPMTLHPRCDTVS